MTEDPAAGGRGRADRLLAALADRPPANGTAGAAVLIVLRAAGPEVEVLLIERAERAGDPGSSQVGLPGGRVDPRDVDLRATALREAEEEVGLAADDLAGPPRYFTTEYARAFGLHVAVFASGWRSDGRAPVARDRREVASVYWLPEKALARVAAVARETRWGPREVDAAVHDGHVLWGFTLRVLREFFGLPVTALPGPDPRP